MPFYIGENKIVDRYIGDKLVIAAYKGESKYFDAYSEITGSFPIVFKSRAAVALKNYLLHGTSEGAGVNTGNLWNGSYVRGRLDISATKYNTGQNTSVIIPCEPETQYTIRGLGSLNRFGIATSASYPSDGMRVTPIQEGSTNIRLRTFTTNSSAQYIIVFLNTVVNTNCFVNCLQGSTAPASYIPHGYQIPLMVTNGEQSTTTPVYIGDSKLGEEEYADYHEQKVYKRTENVFNKDADTHYAYMTVSGGIFTTSGQSWNSMIAFAPIIGGNTYSVKIDGTVASQNLQSVFSIDEPANNVSYRIDGESTYVNHGQVQTFTRTAPTTANWIAIHFYIGLNNPWENVNITIVNSDDIPSQHVPYIQPTDPPVPLPEINTYKGENMLSSTETLGEATIKGRINELPNTP